MISEVPSLLTDRPHFGNAHIAAGRLVVSFADSTTSTLDFSVVKLQLKTMQRSVGGLGIIATGTARSTGLGQQRLRMHFARSTGGKTYLPELAADSEKQSVFVDEYDELYWIARLICGSPERAHIAVVDAGKVSNTANPVFRDWLQKWARAATARAAVEGMLGTILNAALAYSAPTGRPESLDPLSEEEFRFLHALEMERVVERLDPFARAVLVMHGVLQHSISDCARLIGIPRDRVVAAYHRAHTWVQHQQRYGRELEGTTANAGS